MELKNIKKCGACKAFYDGRCELGFSMKTVFKNNTYAIDGTPQELCPKPTTTKDFVKCMQDSNTNKLMSNA